jgi:hypothetical protein
MGDNAIFQEQKIQKFSHNSYDDVGVVTLINRSLLHIGRILINLIIRIRQSRGVWYCEK